MSLLIVNADDFGQSVSVNAGIVEAHRHGILTSTTWLAGGDAADAAVEAAASLPGLGVGLHLALSGVRPVGDPAPFREVLDEAGRWPSRYPFVVRWLARTRNGSALVEAEWRAQVERFIDRWGRLPTHLDSHQHIALLPNLMGRLIRVTSDYQIPALRISQEVRSATDLAAPDAWHRPHETVVLSALAGWLRGRARRAGVRSTDAFAGFRQSGRLDERMLLDLLPRLAARGRSAELMVHPGADDEVGGPFAYRRRQERDALMSPRVRDAVRASGLTLGTFADLP